MTPFEFFMLPFRALEWVVVHSEDIFMVAFVSFLWAGVVFAILFFYNLFRGC